MNANEIKCGNHVINTFLSNIDGIIVADSDVIVFIERFPEQDTYLPVPISVIWLLNNGFEKIGNKYRVISNNYWRGDYYVYKTNGQNWTFALGRDSVIRGYEMVALLKGNMKYAHQIQNLYFALTDNELNK